MIQFPRKWRLYDFIDSDDESIVKKWARGKDGDIIARFNQKFDLLEHHGSDLPPGLLAGTKLKHIDKLRIFGKGVTWRVMICKGPISKDFEFTILFIAQEKDRKLIPKDAEKRAEENRQEIIANPSRRKDHERLNRNTSQ